MLALSLVLSSLYLNFDDVSASTPHLTKNALVMVKNHGYNLKLNGISGEITWKTSNSAVVSFEKVSNTHIKLKAKNTGSATVSAMAGNKTYKCSVKVINAKLNYTSLTMKFNNTTYDERTQLRVKGAKVKKWVIKDPSIVGFLSSKQGVYKSEYKGQVPSLTCAMKKTGKTKVLAYVEDSILTCTVTVKKIADEKEQELSQKEKKEILTYAGLHTTFDGLHIGEGYTYENYVKEKSYGGIWSTRDLAVPVYNGKLVDIRDEKMFQKALRADKVIGKFYREYIKSNMDDMERLQAVFNFLNTRKSVLVTSTSNANLPYTTDSISIKCGNGCSTCQKYMNSRFPLGIPKGSAYRFSYSQSAYAALYSNKATYSGWAEAFEFLCVAAGLKAFMRNYYQLLEPPVLVNLGGYWVEVNVAYFCNSSKKGKYFNFSNGGDIDKDGKINVSEGWKVGAANGASQCQYLTLKSWNRYSSAMPRCYGYQYEYPDTRDVRLYNLDSKYKWKEFMEENSKFYEPLVRFKNNWGLYSCRY